MTSTSTAAPSGASLNYVFRNWAGIYSCKPQLYFQPKSIDEVVNIVKLAHEQKKTIVTVGSGHSPSDMCLTNEWMMNLDNMDDVVEFIEYPENSYADVKVRAGIRIYQLNDYLSKRGYALQNLGSISDQSVAGIISTGTHGSSAYHGLVSSQYVNLTIVNGKGEVLFLDSENNPEVFRAALLSLGKIGIIVEATIRVVPSFCITSTQEVVNFETLLDKWDTIWTSSEFIRCWWYPYVRKCVLWRGVKGSETIHKPRKSWWGTRVGRFIYESLLWITVRIYPSLTPYVEKFVFSRQYGNVETYGHGDLATQTSIDGLNMDCLFSQFVDEWGCPLDNGPEVLRSLDHSISQAAQNKEFFVHVPIEVRCSNTTLPTEHLDYSERNATSLGPVYGNLLRPYLDPTPQHLRYAPLSDVTNSQLTLYINATIYRPFQVNTPIHKWFILFEDTLGAAGGKPHWAKNFLGSTSLAAGPTKEEKDYADYEMRGMATKINEWYGDDLKQFQKIRSEQDPHNVFLANKDWAIRNGIIPTKEN
ncbi:HDL441Wp [Eremothecium sinecaudum]|uniref:D-arabinono-1,4-lactone oxidase n=1 Tax=Eremothecium sinecaudum TaxID=45286 RepID=A0A0X8HRY8_9SACH|nr:HDL441Wp [Eremothecium sinecaudum]AMD20303.1 HDL441Wp [Eremothecium sinecaudum]